jgi:DNA-binding MarR family transcriptional regulator
MRAIAASFRGARRSAPLLNGDDSALALAVWVRLLKTHGLILRELRRRGPEDLTLPQFDVLAQLHRDRDGMTSGELTRALLVTAGNVTGIVGRLARLGLVERRPVPGDRRTARIRLTARGQKLVERALPRHRRDVGALMSALPARDLLALRGVLGRLNESLGGPGR